MHFKTINKNNLRTMKKVLFILVALIAFYGSIFAQHESHWPEDNESFSNLFEDHDIIVAYIQIDNQFITASDNWAEVEIAAFVNSDLSGHTFMVDNTNEGDLYPTIELEVFYDNTNEPVTFKMYNHSSSREYDLCSSNITLLTGEPHNEIYFGQEGVTLSFSSSFTKEIDPWTAEGGFYLITSPLNAEVSPENVLNMTNDDYDLYYFDQDKDLEWINYKGADGNFNLEAGKGYLYANSTGADITFVGAPYNGNGEVTLTKTNNTSADFQGWNLVGNPFQQTAYIDREEYYVMNPADGAEIIAGEGNEIGPMQGIFVIAANNNEKVTFSTENPGKAKSLVINVNKDRGPVVDRAIVRLGEGGLLPKFMLNESHTKLYIPQDDKEYAVVSADDKTNEIPLNFKASEEGTYTLKFNTEDVETGYLHLIDNLLGNDVDLMAHPSYTFDARLSDYASRFRLVFSDTFANSNENMIDGSFAIVNNGNLIINGIEGKATLEMIDITGRIISAEIINGSYNKAIKVKAGVYTLRLIQGENIKTQKIVVE